MRRSVADSGVTGALSLESLEVKNYRVTATLAEL
jgi:hypothetical protein